MKIVYQLCMITILAGLCAPTMFRAMEQEPFMCKVPLQEHEKIEERERNALLQKANVQQPWEKEESERQELIRKQPINFECTDSFDVSDNGNKLTAVDYVARIRCAQQPS